MNKFVDFLDRFRFYRNNGFNFQVSKEKAIAEMVAFGIIKTVEEIDKDKEKLSKNNLFLIS